MGEIAEMMLEGILCQECGVVLDDIVTGAQEPGHPRSCPDCAGKPERKKRQRKRRAPAA